MVRIVDDASPAHFVHGHTRIRQELFEPLVPETHIETIQLGVLLEVGA
jgi:hypothetical protein